MLVIDPKKNCPFTNQLGWANYFFKGCLVSFGWGSGWLMWVSESCPSNQNGFAFSFLKTETRENMCLPTHTIFLIFWDIMYPELKNEVFFFHLSTSPNNDWLTVYGVHTRYWSIIGTCQMQEKGKVCKEGSNFLSTLTYFVTQSTKLVITPMRGAVFYFCK